MASILTHQNIAEATAAVNAYKSTADGLYRELQGLINSLTTDNFNGDASNGYRVFFDTKVTPALTENLNTLADGINSMLESIQTQLLDTVDPELGNSNQG